MSASLRRSVIGVAVASAIWLMPIDVHAQKVAIVAAESDFYLNDVRTKLLDGGLTDVTIHSVGSNSASPGITLAQLQQYNAILTWSNFDYAAGNQLGDLLADYVDGGGGVVHASYAFQLDPAKRLGGRWAADNYSVFSSAPISQAYFLSLVKTQPDHPIFNGVQTFWGGSSSYHHAISTQGCAEIVAKWSNDLPLIAERIGPAGGRVIGLNAYPVSADANASFWWVAGGEGALLLANTLRYAAEPVESPATSGPSVAILAADGLARANDVRCKLEKTAMFSRVDTIDVASTTPSVASLLDYNAVLTWSNGTYADASSLGTVLADYVDQNRGVVHSTVNPASAAGGVLGGRWASGGYKPFTDAPVADPSRQTLVPSAPGHVVLSGVATFDGGSSSYHASPIVVDAAPTVVATWSTDGQPLVATGKMSTGGRVVGLNVYPPSSDAAAGSWERATDGARLLANTLLFASNHFPSVQIQDVDNTVEASTSGSVTFVLQASASDADGDALTYTWTTGVTGDAVTVSVPPPAAGTTSRTVTITVTVSDGKGGEASDSIDLIVTDNSAPTLQNMPTGVLTAEATSESGATVSYGPVTAIDAVDGSVPVECSHAGVFPVGETTVTCSASDSHGNTTSASFVVAVTAPPPPADTTSGSVRGNGFVRDAKSRYNFKFEGAKRRSGEHAADFSMSMEKTAPPRGRRPKVDHFVATTVTSMVLNADLTTVIRGTGTWNGRRGYRYELSGADRNSTARGRRDIVRVTVTSSAGNVVAKFGGELGGGEVTVKIDAPPAPKGPKDPKKPKDPKPKKPEPKKPGPKTKK